MGGTPRVLLHQKQGIKTSRSIINDGREVVVVKGKEYCVDSNGQDGPMVYEAVPNKPTYVYCPLCGEESNLGNKGRHRWVKHLGHIKLEYKRIDKRQCSDCLLFHTQYSLCSMHYATKCPCKRIVRSKECKCGRAYQLPDGAVANRKGVLAISNECTHKCLQCGIMVTPTDAPYHMRAHAMKLENFS